ncbi:hypothetical protein [Anaerotignum lactatifermentans]|uniref:hypothetical protein n=1 Tax=Anaerotignum lactatifermentans TaxID=160404 RepID=UPI003AF03857
MILMVYAGVFLLAYGIYHLVAHLAYFPSGKSGRSISGFWRAMCLELAGYAMKRFSLTSASSGKLKSLLQINQEKKDETVWLLEKCIGSLGVFCLCSPLLLVQPKVFLLCLGVGLFVVWYELLLYCVKSMGDKRILQRELLFFLLLRWKYSLEERNKSDYLAASQMVVAEDIPKEKWKLLEKRCISENQIFTENKNKWSPMFSNVAVDDLEKWYKTKYEFFQRTRNCKSMKILKFWLFLKQIVSILLIALYLVFSCDWIFDNL